MKVRLKRFMKELNFKSTDDIVYGVYDDFLVSVTDNNEVSSLFIDVVLQETAAIDREKIRNIIELNAKQYSILYAEVKNTGISVIFNSGLTAFNKLKDFFYSFINQLNALGIKGASFCSNCGEETDSFSILSINGKLHSCDKVCAEQLCQTMNSKVKTKRKQLYFIPGLLGALFGAILGIIPFVVLCRMDFFILWCGIFVGLFTKGGYEFFKGENCIGKTIIVPIFSLAVIVPAVFINYCYRLSEFWSGKSYLIEFADTVRQTYNSILTVSLIRTSFIIDVAVTFVYALLGLLLFLRFKRNTYHNAVYIVE